MIITSIVITIVIIVIYCYYISYPYDTIICTVFICHTSSFIVMFNPHYIVKYMDLSIWYNLCITNHGIAMVARPMPWCLWTLGASLGQDCPWAEPSVSIRDVWKCVAHGPVQDP